MSPQIYDQLIYDKGVMNIQWGKLQSLQLMVLGNWTTTSKMTKMDCYPYTKVNSKEIKVLTIRPKTTKLLEGNTGGNLLDIGLSDNFWI